MPSGAHPGQRQLGAHRQGHRFSLGDLGDLHQREFPQDLPILQRLEKLPRAAHHGHDDSGRGPGLFEGFTIPACDCLGDRGGFLRRLEQLAGARGQFGVRVQRHHPPAVGGAVEALYRERGVGRRKRNGRKPIDQLPLELVERAQPSGAHPQVNGHVLLGSTAVLPQVGHCRRLGHQRDRGGAGEPNGAGHDGIGAVESDGATEIGPGESVVGEDGVEFTINVEFVVSCRVLDRMLNLLRQRMRVGHGHWCRPKALSLGRSRTGHVRCR